jgi:UDP-N-acetylglucosamine:LPS N-acetylglucosamine transferase
MGKHKKQLRHEFNHTPTTVLMAVFGGACGFITVESFFQDIMELLSNRTNLVHAWQVHMGQGNRMNTGVS